MTLTIEIPPQLEAQLREQADALGENVQEYVERLVSRAAGRERLETLLAPLRKEFAQAGVSDDCLIADITDAQNEYRASKNKPA